jgi:hypothetical protein
VIVDQYSSARNTNISHSTQPVYIGDGYDVSKTITGGLENLIINPPIQINNNLYVKGYANFTNFFPFRNLAINGAMTINQRNPNSVVGIGITTGYPNNYVIDRHETIVRNSISRLDISQSNIIGFLSGNILSGPLYYNCKVGITTASIANAAALHTLFSHKVENMLTNDLGWGTAAPAPVTISFDVISTVTHTYYLAIQNASRNRSYIRDIPVTASTTPKRYAFTISGDNSLTANWRIPLSPGSPNVAYGSNDTGMIVTINRFLACRRILWTSVKCIIPFLCGG